MKKYITYKFKFIAFIAIVFTLIVSCQKDFLEKPAASDVTLDTIFTSSSNAQQVIFSLYHDRFFSPNNIPLNWWDGWVSWSEIGEDMYFPKANWTMHWQYVDGTMSSASDQFYPIGQLFYAVRSANTYIQKVNEIPVQSASDQTYINRMLGEAHAHVAYQYFKGFRIWGSLPWINTRLEGGEEAIPRMPFDELVDSIVGRLDIAANLLPEQWDDRWTGRFTKTAAKALKAKVLVYAASDLYNGPIPSYASGYEHPEVLGYGSYDQQRWKRAADACKEAIDAAHSAGYALYDGAGEEKNIYELAINLTDEHIMYQTFQSSNSEGGWKYVHNMMNWPYGIGWYNRADLAYQPTFQHVDGYQMKDGKFPIEGYEGGDGTKPIISQAGLDAGYSDQNFAKDRDPRFHENIVYHGSKFGEGYNDKLINFDVDKTVPNRTHGDWSGFASGFMVRKFVNEALGESSTVTYVPVHPIIRLADVYLLYAEALNRYNDGPNSEAISYLNMVRSRSGMPDYDATNYEGSTAEDQFQNAIKYERRVEFYLEAQRYFDLRRWKNGDDLEVAFVGCTVNNGVVSRSNLNWTNNWDDKLYFHPFQNDWVNNTPGLFQNPGY
nr:RagB/SusD family nutrient uptake outer membrane protein [uncultured Draconibacterium sp.]